MSGPGLNFFDVGPSLQVPREDGHYVYVHRNNEQRVLYVGSTTKPAMRTANHVLGKRSHWWDQVASIDWFRLGSDADMWWAERQAISRLEPRHNTAHNVRTVLA